LLELKAARRLEQAGADGGHLVVAQPAGAEVGLDVDGLERGEEDGRAVVFLRVRASCGLQRRPFPPGRAPGGGSRSALSS
jgi:hypothetical protein